MGWHLLSRWCAPKGRINDALQIPSLASGAWRRELRPGIATELFLFREVMVSVEVGSAPTLTCLHSVHVLTGRWTDLFIGFEPIADMLKGTARAEKRLSASGQDRTYVERFFSFALA